MPGIIEMVAEIRAAEAYEKEYRIGFAIGRQKERWDLVKAMLSHPEMTPESIAKLTDLPLRYIYKVKTRI